IYTVLLDLQMLYPTTPLLICNERVQPLSNPLQHEHKYLQVGYAQPPCDLAKLNIHPNSAVAQLRLTTEEIEEVLRDQERRNSRNKRSARTQQSGQHQQRERHGNSGSAQSTP